ncbi:hypothetical protein [Jatrophihabitans sp.]|uniref:hypothetical protein n=1 Tax=Jatrophihabitans sp. TaxID=1932789 RepID=UPI002F1D935B
MQELDKVCGIELANPLGDIGVQLLDLWIHFRIGLIVCLHPNLQNPPAGHVA